MALSPKNETGAEWFQGGRGRCLPHANLSLAKLGRDSFAQFVELAFLSQSDDCTNYFDNHELGRTRAATVPTVCGVLRTAAIGTVPESSADADLGTLVNVMVGIFRRCAVSNASIMSRLSPFKEMQKSKLSARMFTIEVVSFD
jgi:hypothetical protein